MKHILIFIFFVFVVIGCTNQTKHEMIKGDLYFRLFDLYRFFDAPDSVLVKFENSVKSLDLDSLNSQERKYYEILKYAIDNNLLRQPYIWIRIDSIKTQRMFVDNNTYDLLKEYNWSDLKKENKKVQIEAEVLTLKIDSMEAYQAVKIFKISKIEGRTYWTK